MRVLVVSNLYPPVMRGGYEVECSGVVEALRGAGHDVFVLTSTHAARGLPREPQLLRALPWLTHDERGALLAPAAALRGVSVLRRVLARVGPDLAYVWNGAQLPQAALRVLLDSGTPTAFRVCEHWFGALFRRDQFLRELLPAERGPARRAWAAGCVTVNRLRELRLEPLRRAPAAVSWNSEAIRRLGGAPSMLDLRLECLGHSVPRHTASFAAVERRPTPDPLLVYVGRVSREKGIETAMGALASLRAGRAPALRLAIAGNGEAGYLRQLQAEAARLGVAGAVDFLGRRTPDEVAGLLGRAAVLVVPSVWQEPFPLVTIEGAFARVPLVASDVGGIGEGMHHEEHALLHPPGDVAACAAAVARTLKEPEETVRRVGRAWERAQDFHHAPYLAAQVAFVRDAHAALTT